jgi:hypothetical protein
MPSVLQEWVSELPLRAQGTLLTAVRGCDLTPQYPLETTARHLVAAIRHAFMVAADPREVDSEPGCLFVSRPPSHVRPSELGHYPWHWLSHVVNAIEVLAYSHPDAKTAASWMILYHRFCRSFHMNGETREQWHLRMTENRVDGGPLGAGEYQGA